MRAILEAHTLCDPRRTLPLLEGERRVYYQLRRWRSSSGCGGAQGLVCLEVVGLRLLAVGYGLEVIRVDVDQLVVAQQAFHLRPHPGQPSAELGQSEVPQAQVHHPGR